MGDEVSSETVALSLSAYAARGRAAYSVRLALLLCTDFTRSVPLDSQSGTSLSRRSRSSPNGLLLYDIYINFVLICEISEW